MSGYMKGIPMTMLAAVVVCAAGWTTRVPAHNDANIVFVLDQASAADSARGALAWTKATSGDVKNFGKLMAGEHHALRLEGQQLAAKLGVTPEEPAGFTGNTDAMQEMDSLQAMPKGKAWDKAYIEFEVAYHKAVLETATKALGDAQNAELKNLITQAAPVIKHHLAEAEQIQKAM
ncbi:MAG TPA: DUF4142 domain-containing protein [Gemmatimonadaceae bacterium]|nr:DUF4142 domain-containing protein [Gemmatimonadaceae bacterium]